ncbi:spore coat protein [Paenibacillus sp. MMS18-CY102]|uniref:spore coat protein n=1 Tax=Paenibacillus sp. MMS18-CY102 TaxID=2682849 RepID=UPI001365B2A5|nr:spore coat protein [Paenibacillus sp. MMS18-CY102]MWC28997.1 spore coat protein [Paenibacillus sp. MMS18-CY102]
MNHHQSLLPDEDLASTILSDLKRVVREYATAATESTCPEIRKLFTTLLDSTLQLQGQMFTVMQQNQMYNTSSPALRQEIDKQGRQYDQTLQKTYQFVQQRLSLPQQQPVYYTGQPPAGQLPFQQQPVPIHPTPVHYS